MEIDIPNLAEIAEDNMLPRVVNILYTDGEGEPTEDGLFSYTFFGSPDSKERKFQWGYIDLKRPVLHPIALDLMTELDSRILEIISGQTYYVVTEEGALVEDEVNGETGLDFLYVNYEKIVFNETGSGSRSDKIRTLKMVARDEAFCTVWLVVPCIYRHMGLNTNSDMVEADEVSDLYKRLVSLSTAIQGVDDIDRSQIQDVVVEIHTLLAAKAAS